jgi:hypothetical protein
MGCEIQLILDEARVAVERLKHGNTFKDWVIVGTALVVVKTSAMAAVHTNKPTGRRYCEEVGALLKEHGLAEVDKGTRSRLLDVMKNRDAVEAWLDTLETPKRLKMNHPTGVLSAWRRATTPPSPAEEPKPRSDLLAVWKNATPDERRAVHDAGGVDLLLGDLSQALREEMESRLANPHAEHRLAEKDAKEKQAVEEAKNGIASRCPQLGTASAPEPMKPRRPKQKPARMKNIGQWRKFDLEKLRTAIEHEQHRSAYDKNERLTPPEFRRLERMKKQEKVLAKDTAASQGNTAAAPRSNGNDVPTDESTETMKVKLAALAEGVPA